MSSTSFRYWTDKVYVELTALLKDASFMAYRQPAVRPSPIPAKRIIPNSEMFVSMPRRQHAVFKHTPKQAVKRSILIKQDPKNPLQIKVFFMPDGEAIKNNEKVITTRYPMLSEAEIIAEVAGHIFNHFVNGHFAADGAVH